MITKKGNVEVEIDGQKFGFRIGTWTFRETQIALGVNSVNAVLEKIGFTTAEINIDAYLDFLYIAACEYKRSVGETIPAGFTSRDIADWLDIMGGVSGSLKYIVEGLNQYVPKNSEAPETVPTMSA